MAGTPLLDGRAVRAALLGGIVGGGLDILYAFIQYGPYGITPQQILHAIASGWLGKASYEGGNATAALGLASHFVIASIAALIYVVASRRIELLVRKPLICGPLFGLGIFLAMNYVIVPISAAVVGPPRGWFWINGLLVHMFLIGLPIALFARRAAAPSEAPNLGESKSSA